MTATVPLPRPPLARQTSFDAGLRGKRLVYVTTVASTQWAFLRGQNQHMVGVGLELHAIASPDRTLERLAERDGVVVHPIGISRRIAPLSDLRTLFSLVATFRRLRPDLIHVSTPKAALLGALAGALSGVRGRVFLMRGLATENAAGLVRRLFRLLERLTVRLCHVCVCVSPSLREFARSEGILGPDEGVVVGAGMSNGIDTERFRPVAHTLGRRPQVIGFVGRLTRDKGIEELEAAWRRIRGEYPNATLLLVGPWEREAPVSGDCRVRLESDPRVMIAGKVDDPVPYYQRMGIFAFPSHGTEGFPNAPMEAAACGLPVVATRVVGNLDAVVDGETGVLIPPRDAAALEVALRRYLDNPDVAAREGAQGRDRVVAAFRPQRIWEGMAEVYHNLLVRTSERHNEG